ncbi:hypothetical protein KUTeg_010290 [Tegillarca granosa]|uniref:BTB domain-containing protein n=1 Tax=Tegillarca granosa TaxID=220873 RepID=A0ABQ9F991_TEGGR|nr:hypothetical protein KUTeg_010290 [Tegillarca granosa]
MARQQNNHFLDVAPHALLDNLQLNPDWQWNNTVLQSLSSICCQDSLSDVSFRFPNHPDVSPVPAHKVILAMRSSVFKAMFYGSLCETKRDVEIADIKPDVFRSFLRFLYTDDVTIDNQSVIPLLYTADKYEIFSLKQQCQNYLENSIDANNVCEIMNAAEMFNIADLVKRSLEFIAKQGTCVFQSDGFKSLTNSNLSMILSQENLNVSEVDLFLACLKWSEQQCISRGIDANPSNKKNALGALLYKIRIPTMTLEGFSKHVATSGILSELEQLQFFKYFTIQEQGPFITKFSSTARRGRGYQSGKLVRLNKKKHCNDY